MNFWTIRDLKLSVNLKIENIHNEFSRKQVEETASWFYANMKNSELRQYAPPASIIHALLESRSYVRCPYREELKEIRFAFWKYNDKVLKLRYRFCPFFSRSFGHGYQIGHNCINDVIHAAISARYKTVCDNCNLAAYDFGNC